MLAMTPIRVATCALLALLWIAAPARAQLDPWEYEVYPSRTVGKGMVELESLNSGIAVGHTEGDAGTSAGELPSQDMYRTAIEVTYGLTDKLEAAAYLNLAYPSGHDLQYAGSKYRLRGSLFEQGQLPVDLGWYLELEWNKTEQFDDSELEFEMKPIIEKDIGRLEINPKFEKAIFVGPDKNKGFEFGYEAGVYYNYWRWASPGVEFYGAMGLIDRPDSLGDQQHYVFPVIRGELGGGIEYNFGLGIGLTHGSDQLIPKLNIELERFVGALFS